MVTKRRNKYVYLWVVQGHYGQGWEDENAEEDSKNGRRSLREYRENMPQYPHRLIQRRELNGI